MLTKEMILSKFQKIYNIREIKKLDTWGQDIEDISIISELPNLEILSLSSNKISSLSPISNCLNAREIYLRNNNIYSFDELYHLQNLSKLNVLWLEGNPISKDIFYREKVFNILPKLHNLDNKNNLFNLNLKKRGHSEEKKVLKNKCDYDANGIKCYGKKILLRRVFSYFETSNEGGRFIDISNEVSTGHRKNKNSNNSDIKKVDLAEFKIKFCNKGKSAKKDKKNFKKIKLKIKKEKIYKNCCNNYLLYNYLGNGQILSNRKLTVDTHPNSKLFKKDNITIQNSIIQQNSSCLKEQKDYKIKKLCFLNKDLYKNIYRYKNNDKINININNYEYDNNKDNLIKAISLLIDKMNIQDLLFLKDIINKKLSILSK